MSRVFLLSPANSSGRRAQLITRPDATFELARRIQIADATVGEVFAFCSSLYFRGKLAYARRFAQPPSGVAGVQVITPSRGLLPADELIGLSQLQEFAAVSLDAMEARFTGPLVASVKLLANHPCEVVLLGSIATGKYVDCLLPVLGQRLLFPEEFVGRGDMSRGGLMLRCAARGEELRYLQIAGAIRRGPRPAKLAALIKPAARE